MRYILNNETQKTSHGFYLLNAGGDFKRFNDNPVMLFAHDETKPIGLWSNTRIEGVELLADPQYNNNELALDTQEKVEKGQLRGLSIGMYINNIIERYNPLTDTKDYYVIEWEMLEASVVSIPSNAKSLVQLKVYDKKTDLEVADVQKFIKLQINNNKKMEIETVNLSAIALVKLAVRAEEATPGNEKFALAIEKLVGDNTSLQTKVDTLEKEKKEALQAQATTLVEAAIKEGRIDATKKEEFTTLAVENYTLAKGVIDSIPIKKSLTASLNNKEQADERSKWTYSDWKREAPTELATLKETDPVAYKKILTIKK